MVWGERWLTDRLGFKEENRRLDMGLRGWRGTAENYDPYGYDPRQGRGYSRDFGIDYDGPPGDWAYERDPDELMCEHEHMALYHGQGRPGGSHHDMRHHPNCPNGQGRTRHGMPEWDEHEEEMIRAAQDGYGASSYDDPDPYPPFFPNRGREPEGMPPGFGRHGGGRHGGGGGRLSSGGGGGRHGSGGGRHGSGGGGSNHRSRDDGGLGGLSGHRSQGMGRSRRHSGGGMGRGEGERGRGGRSLSAFDDLDDLQ